MNSSRKINQAMENIRNNGTIVYYNPTTISPAIRRKVTANRKELWMLDLEMRLTNFTIRIIT